MAQAIKRPYGDSAKLTIGPSIDNGFYYDFDVEKPFTEEDLAKIEILDFLNLFWYPYPAFSGLLRKLILHMIQRVFTYNNKKYSGVEVTITLPIETEEIL